ncbi:MAG TPA: phosphate ABC transporter substrate-binding protein PstS [Acidimicrobiales bacterium]|nr:phosphate ABC transporter substrate-binding protein PstS [Acidimicrobiales bacterium]
MLLAVAVLGAGCGGQAAPEHVVSNEVGAGDRAVLRGAGSTFAAPMVEEWARRYRVGAPGVDIRYEASGSGAGLRLLPARTAEFALSELPVPEQEQRQGAVQVPVLAGAVAVAYNLPGVAGLLLSEDTLARIYSGEIRRWDAAAIKRDNPSRQLPSTAVTAVHRTDSSGSTLAFTRYLATAGEIWRPGSHDVLEWPTGAGAVGSAGMLTTLTETAGAIGYLAAGAALDARLQVANLRNGGGQFVAPTPVAVDAALNGAVGYAENLTLSLPATQESPTAYPIVVITHLVFLTGLAPPVDVALRRFAGWILSEGQRAAAGLGFSPLPLPLVVRTLEGLQGGGIQPRR